MAVELEKNVPCQARAIAETQKRAVAAQRPTVENTLVIDFIETVFYDIYHSYLYCI